MPPAVIHSLDELRALTGDHPYVRSSLRHSAPPLRAWSRPPALVWTGAVGTGPMQRIMAVGPPERVAALLGEVVPELPEHASLSVTRGTAPLLTGPIRLDSRAEWNFRWTYRAPPALDGEAEVETLSAADGPEVDRLLDEAAPRSSARPGAAYVRRWLGLRRCGQLVAVAADTSGCGVGHMSSVATATEHRGQGLGTILATALTRWLHAEFGVVTLGVYADNATANRLYTRLGFTDEHQVTSGPRRG